MVSYEELYQILEKPLSWIAEDHNGVITKNQLRMTIIERMKITDRATVDFKIKILVAAKVLVPTNKTSFKFTPNGKKDDGDGERTAIEKQLAHISGRVKE